MKTWILVCVFFFSLITSTNSNQTPPAKIIKIYSNYAGAFAGRKTNGTVITWGNTKHGGDSSSVASELGTPQKGQEIIDIIPNQKAFAAIRKDGSVVTWGYAGFGGDSSAVAAQLQSGVKSIFANQSAFAALKKDHSVVFWGDSHRSPYYSDTNYADIYEETNPPLAKVSKIVSSEDSFSVLRKDGSVTTWEMGQSASRILRSTDVSSRLRRGVVDVVASRFSFAALKDDGTVVTWGSEINWIPQEMLGRFASNKAIKLFSGQNQFAALKKNGSVLCWSNDKTLVIPADREIKQIIPINYGRSFLAITKKKAAFVFGLANSFIKDTSDVNSQLSSGVEKVFSNFANVVVLKDDHSIVAWGRQEGIPSAATLKQLGNQVETIIPSDAAFAARKKDGSVVTWGLPWAGGDSSSVANDLSSDVIQVVSSEYAFSALRGDGTVVSWGRFDKKCFKEMTEKWGEITKCTPVLF